MTPLLKTMMTALDNRKVSDSIIRDYNELETMTSSLQVALKYAQKTQENVLNLIYDDLLRLKPDYSYNVGNNVINNKDDSNRFCINGIVGLSNFSKSISYFALELLLLRDNKPHAMVAYNPILNEKFYTEKGKGAFWNQKRLRFAEQNGILALNKASIADFSKLGEIIISNCKVLDLYYLAVNKYSSVRFKNIKNGNALNAGMLLCEEAGINFNKLHDDTGNLIELSFLKG